MSHVVLSSYLSVGSEKLNACLFSPLLGYYSNTNTNTNKNILSHGTFTSTLGNANKAAWKNCMLVHSKQSTPAIQNGVLNINGKDALLRVPDNVILTPNWTEEDNNNNNDNNNSSSAFFIGAKSTQQSSRHVFKLGVIQEDMRYLCLFRFKMWWMIPRVGNLASDIPVETQMLMLEANGSGEAPLSYIVLLPVLDGDFRTSLQGNSHNEVEFCVESGDPAVVASESLKAIFVNYGNNPFDLMADSMKILEKYMGTFSVRESKQMPGILDCFGWCTWDAFYQDVNPQGIKDGLQSLAEGGTPARFLIIDDGWQDTTNEFRKEGEPVVEGSQFGARLMSIEENSKFRITTEGDQSERPSSLKKFVSDIKATFGLKYVYVWHALMGYWGGLNPDSPQTKKYNPKLKYLSQSPGNLANMRDISLDCMEKYGVGTIDPSKINEFYDDLHMYLSSQEVDGVKVDVQNLLETVAAGLGGRVSLTRHFQQALEKSIAANFRDNSIICCMGLSTDTIYNSKTSAITRASDDYYPKNPKTQTLHIAAVAYNSILLGEVVVPDWDMFYSQHSAAEFHAVARAVGGCGVYVSDKPGQHDFGVLKRLVLPNGSILRAKYPGRPTRDCLFVDPVTDGKSVLKIWNMNKLSGVIGVFNCQGAGSWPCVLDNNKKEDVSINLSCQVSPATDIEHFKEELSGDDFWTGDFAVYSFMKGTLTRLSKKQSFGITLKTLECDVLTVSPLKVYGEKKIEFAAIGLIDMYNSGGAIDAIQFLNDNKIKIKGRGVGRFGAYSDKVPKYCFVNSKEEPFHLRTEDFLLTIPILVDKVRDQLQQHSWEITIVY